MSAVSNIQALRPTSSPGTLVHRDEEVDELARALRPITDELAGEDTIVSGPPGAGKTTLVKSVCRDIESDLGAGWGYCDCHANASPAAALYELVWDAGRGHDLRKGGISVAGLLDRLRGLDERFIAVVDDAHVHSDLSMLSSLYEIENVTLVVVAVDGGALFDELDEHTRSRLGTAVRIHLDPYDHQELVDVLANRIEVRPSSGGVDDGALSYIADLADGDARVAIALLRRATRRAIETDRDRITESVVTEIAEDVRASVHRRHLASLSGDHRLLYRIIREAGEIGAGDLHEAYERRAENPKSKRTRRRYCRCLERTGLVESTGSGPSTRYRPADGEAR